MNFIVTQLKNENKRINEWIQFHLKNGFDKIIIYLDYPEDGSDQTVKEISLNNNNVLYFNTIHNVPINTPYGTVYTGTKSYKSSNDYSGNSTVAYSLAYSYKRGLEYIKQNFEITENDWVAFIDVDEFIVKTGNMSLVDFLIKFENMDRFYITSYDMKCPIDLNESVIKQSTYRWSDKTRNESQFVSRGKMISKVYNLEEILCCHTLDSDINKNVNKFTKTMSTGGNLVKENHTNVVDFFHDQEYFKLFHYRNDGQFQKYDEYDDSALKQI